MCVTVIVDPMNIELETIRDVAEFLGITPQEVDPDPETFHFGSEEKNVLPISSYDFCLCGVDVQPLFEARGYAYTRSPAMDPFSDHVIKTGPPKP
jgi:hypothetical protein